MNTRKLLSMKVKRATHINSEVSRQYFQQKLSKNQVKTTQKLEKKCTSDSLHSDSVFQYAVYHKHNYWLYASVMLTI